MYSGCFIVLYFATGSLLDVISCSSILYSIPSFMFMYPLRLWRSDHAVDRFRVNADGSSRTRFRSDRQVSQGSGKPHNVPRTGHTRASETNPR